MVHFLVDGLETSVEEVLQAKGLAFLAFQVANLVNQLVCVFSCLGVFELVMAVLWEQAVLEQVPNEWHHDFLGLFVQQFSQNSQKTLRNMVRLGIEPSFSASMFLVQLNHGLSENFLIEFELFIQLRVVLEDFQQVGVQIKVLDGESRLIALLKVFVDQVEEDLKDLKIDFKSFNDKLLNCLGVHGADFMVVAHEASDESVAVLFLVLDELVADVLVGFEA